MNTRLQVEHPVTEMVTGVDLVKLQIAIAAGEKLSIPQEQVVLRGAAIECRIYAEDPDNNFFPSPGKIVRMRTPSGPGIRDDSGVYEGWTVPIDYDPMISKLVAWAPSRTEAIARMQRALCEYQVEGIKSNIRFFREILRQQDFLAGDFDTGFIDRWVRNRGVPPDESESHKHLAAIAAALFHSQRLPSVTDETQSPESAWKVDGRRRGLRNE
jgi:acetyl-CoA carboxylase biotin carboxylase subunit